ERAEADGNVISKQENRRAFGKHLTYLAKEDLYTMVGLPAKVYDDVAPDCKYTEAATVSFQKGANTTSASGSGTNRQKSQSIACGTVVGGSHWCERAQRASHANSPPSRRRRFGARERAGGSGGAKPPGTSR